MRTIKESVSQSALTELLQIALVSMIHTRRIIDFVIDVRQCFGQNLYTISNNILKYVAGDRKSCHEGHILTFSDL